MKIYLDGEVLKKNKPIPPTFSALNLDDPNATDQWLRENGFKPGVITGFAQWAIVELSVCPAEDETVLRQGTSLLAVRTPVCPGVRDHGVFLSIFSRLSRCASGAIRWR
jgi:hypothetical protein